MGLRLIDGDELDRALPMAAAIDVIETAFRARDPQGSLRSATETSAGQLLLMPAMGPEGVGVKLVTLTEDNPARGLPFVNAMYVLFSGKTQVPEAVIDGAALTALRTAAVSGVATRFLAGRDARRLVVFGAGVQARAHLEAMGSVRSIREVIVVSRSSERGEALVARARSRGLDAGMGQPEAVASADIICTCTTAGEPVFDGSLVRPGVHVNAIGTHQPDRRELDAGLVRRARVVVETREAALAEAGELAIPIAAGEFDPSHIVADLAELVRGAAVRSKDDDVTVFKSVGIAFEDLVIARAAIDRVGA